VTGDFESGGVRLVRVLSVGDGHRVVADELWVRFADRGNTFVEGALRVCRHRGLVGVDILAVGWGDSQFVVSLRFEAWAGDADAVFCEVLDGDLIGRYCDLTVLRVCVLCIRLLECAGLRSRLRVGGGSRSGSLSCCDDWGCGQAGDGEGHRGGEGELLHILLSKITDVCEGLRM